MQRIGWIGLVALVGLGVWWMTTSSRQPDHADAGVGAVESSRADASPDRDTAAQPPKRSSATPGSLVGAGAGTASPERPADRLLAGESPGAESAGGSSPSPARVEAEAPGSDSGAATRPPTGRSETADIVAAAPSVGRAAGEPQNSVTGRSPSGRDEISPQSQSATGDPIADEVVIDYLARRSLGEDPTPEQLNERRGWAATLLSGESQEVRNELKARADEAAALE